VYHADGLVGHGDVEGVDVGGTVDGDRLDAHLLGRAHHAAGNLATVGHQDFVKERLSSAESKVERASAEC